DDLEALGHVFIYFLRGGLPWQGLKAATDEQKYEKIGERKQTVPIRYLCESFPKEFDKYLTYVRNLGFEDTPDYDYLHGLLTQVLQTAGDAKDGEYDWMKLNGGLGSKVLGFNSSALEQVHHSNVHQGSPAAVITHDQVNKKLLSIEHHCSMKPLPYPAATRFVPRRNEDNQSNLYRTQNHEIPLQSLNVQHLRRQEPETEGFLQKISTILGCSGSRRQ
ncbi:Palmitoylated plasma membrane-bound casein kinase, partial [Ascochyta clinopodiicola]